jgi:cyanate lyase
MKILQDRLDELSMNPRELAMKMDKAYDHIRVIVKGEKFGSDLMVREIGRRLNINEDLLMLAYREDKAEQAGHKIPPTDPLLVQWMTIFSRLSEEGKDQIMKLAELLTKSDVRAVQKI